MSAGMDKQIEGGLIHATVRNARAEQEFGGIVAGLEEQRRRFDAFTDEHGRRPHALERMKIRKEIDGEVLPDDWVEQMRDGLMEMQRREDAGETLEEILEGANRG